MYYEIMYRVIINKAALSLKSLNAMFKYERIHGSIKMH